MRKPARLFDRWTGSWRLGVAPAGAALVESRRWGPDRPRTLAERQWAGDGMDPWSPLRVGLNALMGETAIGDRPASRAVGAVVADSQARLFVVTPPRNASRLQDCRAAAALRFRQLYGEPATEWAVSGDWHATLPFLACAMPLPLLRILRETAREHRLALVSVVPHFIASWNRWARRLEDGAWFGVVDDDGATLTVIHRGRIGAVLDAHLPADALLDPQWLSRFLARQSLILNLPAPQKLQWCGHLANGQGARSLLAPLCAVLRAAPAADSAMSRAACLALAGARP